MKQYETTVRLVKLGMAWHGTTTEPQRTRKVHGGWFSSEKLDSAACAWVTQYDQEGRQRIRQFSSLHMSACSPSVASSCVSLQVS